ncbi:MAG: hypothetical protein Q7W16_01950 [Coriobacteriia bacterium]|nr:hypothetical protein [Coriobacteriia bacterium]
MVSDWYPPASGEDRAGVDDGVLSDVDWSGSPAAAAAAPEPEPDFALDEPIEERGTSAGRRGAAPVRRQGSHSMDGMRISRGAFWGFLALALVIGLAIGGGVLVWQRTTLLADIRKLETRLTAAEQSMTSTADQLAQAQTQLASAEGSIAALAAQNTQLTSDLASATAALTAAKSTTLLTITERTVSPTSVEASHTLALQAKVQGSATKVQMKIIGTGLVASYSATYSLTKSTTTGGITTWKRSVKAPAKKGVYRYYATGYIGTSKFEMPGVSAWTFEVK